MRVTRYLRQYFRPSPVEVTVSETVYIRDGQVMPAAVYQPSRHRGRLPAWVVLHGLTYHGLNHPALQRFASALAASGHLVFIPKINEWTRLLVSPALTAPTIHASVEALRLREDVDHERIGVFGFSFGATQGMVALNDEAVAKGVRTLVAWGGYCDLRRLLHFGVTGEHEFGGVREILEPDPYGRWMLGGNYLTQIPGYENMQAVQDALLELARAAGRSGIYAGEFAETDVVKLLAARLSADERRVYELFAPIGPHDVQGASTIADGLAETIARVEPLMDATPFFPAVRVPVFLTHGRDDRLVPYTETLRIRERLPAERVTGCTITALFSHSGGTEPDLGVIGLARETARFVQVLHRILIAL